MSVVLSSSKSLKRTSKSPCKFVCEYIKSAERIGWMDGFVVAVTQIYCLLQNNTFDKSEFNFVCTEL